MLTFVRGWNSRETFRKVPVEDAVWWLSLLTDVLLSWGGGGMGATLEAYIFSSRNGRWNDLCGYSGVPREMRSGTRDSQQNGSSAG